MVFTASLETLVKINSTIFSLSLLSLLFAVSEVALAKSMGIVVSGLGGSAQYEEQFVEQGQTIVDGLRSLENDASAFTWLSANDATKENILAELSKPAVKNADVFFLVLLGHGVSNAEGWWFNLSGPDLNSNDLVTALNQITAPKQVVVAATSASGALLPVLSQPGRAVVTATKSGGEINAVRFPQYVAEALLSANADADRNELLTLAELWRYANSKTQEYYKKEKLLASEHARINSANLESLVIAKMGALKAAKDNPEVAELLDQRLQLEAAFLSLKAKKTALGITRFYEQLEPLLIDIAVLQQKIDAATGWVEP